MLFNLIAVLSRWKPHDAT